MRATTKQVYIGWVKQRKPIVCADKWEKVVYRFQILYIIINMFFFSHVYFRKIISWKLNWTKYMVIRIGEEFSIVCNAICWYVKHYNCILIYLFDLDYGVNAATEYNIILTPQCILML